MRKSYEIDMCSGPLLSRILLFAIPLICSGVLQLVFNATDIIVVGRFVSSNAMAAVGSTSSLINLLVNFFIGISVGANVLVARFRGANDFDDAQETVQTALITAVAGGFVLIALGILLARPMLVWMATPDEVIGQAVLYMRVYFIGMPATMLYNFGAAILRAVGDTRRPLYFLTLAGLVNVAGDLLFVLVLDMGVAGVAVATVISQIISATLIVLCLMRQDGMCNVNLRRMRFHRDKFLRIMQVGLPAGLQSVIFNISNVLIQSSINSFGATVVAGNTAASNIEGFVYTSMNALYQTSLSFTSQNLGARQFGRIDKILVRCLALVFVIGLVLGNGAHLLGQTLLGIYTGEPEVIAYGMMRLGVVSVTYCLCGMMDVVAGSVRGLGYSILPMLVSLVGACVFRIIWIFTVFQWQHTLFSLYISYPISWALTICAHLVCYFAVRRRVFPRTAEK
ncbi:MAG TPA: MATE family efflux transporter [Candidatus Agathobaculum pullistercoris]|nr:MATE family efflux transporter [uncultured Agathobaculum sp.]HIX11588.1 MATE family efflux transporter [Candidatus Agathobaculum pullistercoris]